MRRKSGTDQSQKENREDRLKAALKANMAKRKAQARARSAVNPAKSADVEHDSHNEQDR